MGGYITIPKFKGSDFQKSLILAIISLLILSQVAIIIMDNVGVNASINSREFSASGEIMINDNTGASNQAEPSIAVYKTWIYAAWHDHRHGDFDIFFSSSSDGGATWGDGIKNTDKRINDDSGAASQKYPEIAINSQGDIFIAWQDNRFGDWDIFYSFSMDGGVSWSKNFAVNGTTPWPGDQNNPSMAIGDNDHIFIAFENDGSGKKDIEVVRSTDKGITFGTNETVAESEPKVSRTDVDIAEGTGGSIFITWSDAVDSTNSHIYLSRTSGDWPAFIEPIQVDNETLDVIKTRPCIDVFNGKDAYITWLENENNVYNIFFDTIFSGEEASHPDTRVNLDANVVHSETTPGIIVTSVGLIYVAWSSTDSGNHILISESLDGGLSFNNEITVDTTTGLEEGQERYSPEVVGSGKDLFIAWEDYRSDPLPSDGIPDNSDVFFANVVGNSNQKPGPIGALADPLSWDKVQLNWSLSHEPDFYSYLVEISSELDFDPLNIIKSIQQFERATTSYTFTDLEPDMEYHFRVTIQDSGGFSVIGPVISAQSESNTPPELTMIEPDGKSDIANTSFMISWTDFDPDDNATITIYYYHDLLGENEIIMFPWGEDSDVDSYSWNTTGLIEGDFTIKIVINDGHNTPVIRVSSFSVNVNHQVDVNGPEIVSIYPADIEVEAPATSSIKITFDEPINQTSVEDSITVYNLVAGTIAGTQFYDSSNQTLIFIPGSKLELDFWYSVKFQADVEDTNGNINKISLTWRFKTAAIDVIFISPIDGAVDVPLGENIVMTFSETMNTSSVELTFNIQPPLNNLLFSWSLFNSTLTVNHTDFDPGQKYVLTLGPKIRSKSNKLLQDRITINFKTVFQNIAPELTDHGFFELDDKFIFFTEYTDENNDPAGGSEIIIYKRNKFYTNGSMSPMTRQVANSIKKFYEPGPELLDGNFNNSELFYFEVDLSEGKYRYFFDFEDIHGARATSETVPLDQKDSAEGPYVKGETQEGNWILVIAIILAILILAIFLLLSKIGFRSAALDDDIIEVEDEEEIPGDEPDEKKGKRVAKGKNQPEDEENDKDGPGVEEENKKKQSGKKNLRPKNKS